ncbi:5-formyltetrahydrofolate cyclo-ligase [Rickettsiella endosymbiont of Miltochrista miniata]|uniref:5-formyltetrahydrofolate cyclo-ligase n=1 Tax=Rickettsiella endosymbiont of Miltochrista miniata TaxID=3066239 RepID=UPI00313DB1FB
MDTRLLSRKKLQQQRAKITLDEQKKVSTLITEQLSHHPLFLQSQTIASYIAIQKEIDPSALIQIAWQNKQTCYLPILQRQQLVFCEYQAHTLLKKNHFNIPEPPLSANACIAAENIDLVLVPLVGFTEKGQRLGMGAGFYDRSFAFLLNYPRSTRPFLLGLAYEWQKLASFTEKSWDVPLNAVITEKQIYYSG